MNKNFLYVLPLALAMVATTSYCVAEDAESSGTAGLGKCEGEPQAPMVTLNLEQIRKANKTSAKPECALAHLGSTIVFRLVPKKDVKDLELGSVLIKPKNPLDTWLQGSNDTIKDLIIIQVPGEHVEKTEYQYSDYFYKVKIGETDYDPRVRIEH